MFLVCTTTLVKGTINFPFKRQADKELMTSRSPIYSWDILSGINISYVTMLMFRALESQLTNNKIE